MGYDSELEMGFGFVYSSYSAISDGLLQEIFAAGVAPYEDEVTGRLEAMGFDQVIAHMVGDSRTDMDYAFLAKNTLAGLSGASAGDPKAEVSARALEQLQKVQEMLLARKARGVSKIEWQTLESIY